MDYYILDDQGNHVPTDLMTWARWFEEPKNRIIRQFVLPGGVAVSTVFMGIDHNLFGGWPLLYETMIFGGSEDGYQQRYSTRAEALAGHAEAVSKVKGDPS